MPMAPSPDRSACHGRLLQLAQTSGSTSGIRTARSFTTPIGLMAPLGEARCPRQHLRAAPCCYLDGPPWWGAQVRPRPVVLIFLLCARRLPCEGLGGQVPKAGQTLPLQAVRPEKIAYWLGLGGLAQGTTRGWRLLSFLSFGIPFARFLACKWPGGEITQYGGPTNGVTEISCHQ